MGCVAVAEEVLRGWLSILSSTRDVADQVIGYQKLSDGVNMLAEYTMLPWDSECAARFKAFRSQGVRIGTMDLKIACIALEYDATVLTRNTVDFARIAGLRFENWLD